MDMQGQVCKQLHIFCSTLFLIHTWKPPATFEQRPFWQTDGALSVHSSMSKQSRPEMFLEHTYNMEMGTDYRYVCKKKPKQNLSQDTVL